MRSAHFVTKVPKIAPALVTIETVHNILTAVLDIYIQILTVDIVI